MLRRRIIHQDALDFSRPVDSWWEASAKPMRNKTHRIELDESCDITIVGGGFTGLNAGLELAKSGFKVIILEAGHVGWGASGRNGGFCANPGTKMSWREIAKKYSVETARSLNDIQNEAIAQVREFITAEGLNQHTPQTDGEICLAHSPRAFQGLKQEVADIKDILGIKIDLLGQEDLQDQGAFSGEFSGGAFMPWGFGIHPLNYQRALADSFIEAGGKLYTHSEVQKRYFERGRHYMVTNRGTANSRHVIFASNAYTPRDVPFEMNGRLMPAMSNILVTRPLTDNELNSQGWTSRHLAYDTRTLLHYFRLLPDNRMLFGGRGAVHASKKSQVRFQRELRMDFNRIFPHWQHVETDYTWGGHVCLNRNKCFFFGSLPGYSTQWIGISYHGSGVAMASWTGKTIAQCLKGEKSLINFPHLLLDFPDPYPAPIFRNQYLNAAYAWFKFRDRA